MESRFSKYKHWVENNRFSSIILLLLFIASSVKAGIETYKFFFPTTKIIKTEYNNVISLMIDYPCLEDKIRVVSEWDSERDEYVEVRQRDDYLRDNTVLYDLNNDGIPEVEWQGGMGFCGASNCSYPVYTVVGDDCPRQIYTNDLNGFTAHPTTRNGWKVLSHKPRGSAATDGGPDIYYVYENGEYQVKENISDIPAEN